MIQIRSRLDVADNTGARMATMIGVIGKASMKATSVMSSRPNVKEASSGHGQKGRGRPRGRRAN